MEKSLAWDIENDVYAGEMTHEERCKVARAAAPALMEEGARLALEAAAELANEYDDKSSLMTTAAIISRLLRNTDPAAIVKGKTND